MRIALATQRDLWSTEVDDLPLHDALRHRGWRVETPVWDDPTVRWEEYRVVVPRTTWDYVPKITEFLSWIERVASVTTLVNDPQVMTWNLDKRYLRDLETLGVPCVPTRWVEGPDDVVPPLEWERNTLAFLKPAVGAGASGTLRFRTDEDGLAWARRHVEGGGRFLLQPYLDSVGVDGERSAVVLGGDVSHLVQKVPPPGDYRVQDEHGGLDRPWELRADERVFLDQTLRALQVVAPRVTLARIDWLTGPGGHPVLCELELVEPSLFFRHGPGAAARLADLLGVACEGNRDPS
jgi:hypothetical protein